MAYNCTTTNYDAVLTIVGNDTDLADTVCSLYNVSSLGATNAVLSFTVKQLQLTEAKVQIARTVADASSAGLYETKYGLNTTMVLFGAFGVFIMQIGFAMFVAGVVRSKNIGSILMKSAIDTCISALGYYLLGYGFTFGNNGNPNGFIGNSDFALSETTRGGGQHYDLFVWNWVFCAVSTTIMAGSVAERGTFFSYVLYACFYSMWVYPVVAHWHWSDYGWLCAHNPDALLGIGVIDFAGSGVVHTLGGFAALMGSIVLGARVGRFDSSANQTEYKHGHNPPLYLLGTFLLWVGWYSFNPISNLAIDTYSDAETVARTATTTTLSAASSGCMALIIIYWRTRTWDMLTTCTGILGGLVAITAGCSVVEPWAAIICGVVAAPCVVYGDMLLDYFKIDDPACAFSLHALSGIWGVLFVGLLAREDYMIKVYDKPPSKDIIGLFYGGNGKLLLAQFTAVVVTIAWTCGMMYGFFWLLNKLGMLRVGLAEEAAGLDQAAMGESAMVSKPTDAKVMQRGATTSHSTIGLVTNPSYRVGSINQMPLLQQVIHEDGFNFDKLANMNGSPTGARTPSNPGSRKEYDASTLASTSKLA